MPMTSSTDDAPVAGCLTLADGTRYRGHLYGAAPAPHPLAAEVVFTTAMGGYPEAITDPSYQDQILVLAYPQAGIYGVPADEVQSRAPMIHALVVRDLAPPPPDAEPLDHFLARFGIPLLAGVDTRSLIRHLRTRGTVLGTVAAGWEGVAPDPGHSAHPDPLRAAGEPARAGEGDLRVSVVDLGAKRAVIEMLARQPGVRVRTFRPEAGVEAIVRDADAVVLSNGPGDPAEMVDLVPLVRALAEERPTFGICLGHQLLATAFGARTFKLPFGHRGVNHPVRHLTTGRTWITSHNHGYAVAEDGLPAELEVTARDLTDGTVEGLRHRQLPVVSLQFHPEGAPGPREADAALEAFLEQVRRGEGQA
ncbi:MAG: glutamine-hydrolyzing carbamoyl-phosphate synthase small subunit [Firmicutes bacterium]|nr:glutamine-hydrolyzing carbamoyl-phosphate synthase small subunit [Bacillota bacterium]